MVSAIITTHNRTCSILRRAIDSVIKQTYTGIEIIVVDDSSPSFEDRTNVINMMKNEYPMVKYILHDRCLGACASRNDGIKISRGEYVAFLDDDDEWLPEKTQIQIEILEKHQDAALVYCDYYVIEEGKKEKKIHNKKESSNDLLYDLFLDNIVGGTSFPLIRKTNLINVGMFDPEMPQAQDYDLWIRLARKYDFQYINKPLVNYYIHSGEQITKNIDRIIIGQQKIIEKNMDLLLQNKYLYWKRLSGLPPLYAKKRRPIKALSTLKHMILLQPGRIFDNIRCIANTISNMIRIF